MFGHFPEHDLGALGNWKTCDAGAHGGKCDGAKFPFGGNPQRMRRRSPQRSRRRFSPELHARRMNHEPGAKFAARGDCRATDRYAADVVAFPLDRIAAFATDRASYTAS